MTMTWTTSALAVPDLSCEHCRVTLEGALGGLDGVARLDVDVHGKVVTVEHDGERVPADELARVVEDEGYDVVGRSQELTR
jgi:copper chaperone